MESLDGEGSKPEDKGAQFNISGLDLNKLLLLGIIIISIIGLIAVFSLPWITVDREGDTQSYYYGDFGGDFEEDVGSDEMDDYYHGSANLAIIGFILLALVGIFLFLQSMGIKIGPIENVRAKLAGSNDRLFKTYGLEIK